MGDTSETEQPQRMTSEPPQAKTARAAIDAVGDAVQNLAIIGALTYAWLGAHAIDKVEWFAGVAAVAGIVNIASVVDRFTKGRVPRGLPGIVAGMMAGKAGGAATAAAAAGEVAKRTLLGIVLLALGGCASTQAPPTLPRFLAPAEVAQRVADMTEVVNGATLAANVAESAGAYVCETQGADACAALKGAHAITVEAIGFATRAIDAFEAIGETVGATEQAYALLRTAVGNALSAAKALAAQLEIARQGLTDARMDPAPTGPPATPLQPAAEAAASVPATGP